MTKTLEERIYDIILRVGTVTFDQARQQAKAILALVEEPKPQCLEDLIVADLQSKGWKVTVPPTVSEGCKCYCHKGKVSCDGGNNMCAICDEPSKPVHEVQSIQGNPPKGQAGISEEPKIYSWSDVKKLLAQRDAEVVKMVEELVNDKDHICRFNDGEQNCDCWNEACTKIIRTLTQRK